MESRVTVKRPIVPRRFSRISRVDWRICIPKDIRHHYGQKHRYFRDETAAEAYATGLTKKRQLLQALRELRLVLAELSNCPDFRQVTEAAQPDRLAELSKMELPPLTLTDAFEQVVASKKQSGKRANSIATLTCSLKSFAAACHKPAGDVAAADVEAWLYANDWTPKTRRGRLTDLNTAFGWLVSHKKIKDNPVTAVEQPAVTFKKPEILTVDEIEKILRACEEHDPALLGHVAMILFGGLRRAESARAEAKNVIGGIIEITGEQTKLNTARNVKINDTLAAWLAVPGVELGGKKLFERMKRIRELAGVEIPQNALRHSAASYWREYLGGIESARMLGHSETVALKSYAAKVTPEEARRFVALRPMKTDL